MCGIAGDFTWKGRAPMRPDALQPIIDAMWRRGPDGSGIWGDERLTAGNRRLAVMDRLPRADLPMCSPDGRYVLAYNGELYDHARQAEALRARGWTFRTRSDSEVVLAALSLDGEAALADFNGMFALAFYDRREHRLLLARDHAGIKPLYVWEGRHRVFFSSEFDSLAAVDEARASSIDCDALADYLRFGHIPAPASLLEDASLIEPGTWIRYDGDGHKRSARYFERGKSADPAARGGDEADSIEAAVDAAVRRQMVSDAPVGCFLSGGIDSPLIAAIAAAHAGQPIHTFSAAVDFPGLDESADAEAYARAIRSDHHSVTLSAENLLTMLDEVIDATHEPNGDEGMFPSLLVAKLASRHVQVCLSGDGADELFFGYVDRQLPALRAGNDAFRPNAYLAAYHAFSEAQFKRVFPAIAYLPGGPENDPYSAPGPHGLHGVRRIEYDHYLPSILMKSDRATAHHALEMRVPFLDRAVIDAAARANATELVDLSSGLGKLPLRRALQRRTGHQTQGKRGFTAPMDAWLRGPLEHVARASIDRFLQARPIDLDSRALASLANAHFDGRVDVGLALWRIVLLDLWWNRKMVPARAAPSDVNWNSADQMRTSS